MTKRKYSKRTASLAKTREQLARFAHDIRGLVDKEHKLRKPGRTFPPSVSHDFAIAVAAAFEAVVKNPKTSLDRELGLIRRGRPPTRGKHFKIALEALVFRAPEGTSACPTWKETLDNLAERGIVDGMDKRDLQKICERERENVVNYLSEQMAVALNRPE